MQGRRADSSKGQHSRLPVIALRDDTVVTLPSSSHVADSNIPPDVRRSRLPPRSRSGCWTCRTRKVKCDEQRPECGECLRLGHICDYNPRLSFRDDTPRTVERMREVFMVGPSVFDGHSPIEGYQQKSEDLLPPFSALTSDEERERKAQSTVPGTYHVIANPTTFAELPEYREEIRQSHSRRQGSFSIPIPRRSTFSSEFRRPKILREELEDPNTVILDTFDDALRKGQSQIPYKADTNLEVSPTSSQMSFSQGLRSTPISVSSNPVQFNLPMFGAGRNSGNDASLLQHYRTTISPHIINVQRREGEEDIFEIQARTYPPLYHAMVALAALSMAHRNGVQNANALEHYQQVIPALQSAVRSSTDSFSDGALFTHFILLLYEIAAAGHRETNMWQHHSNQLLRIVTLRMQAYGAEPYGFIVWNIFRIDIYALLSMAGTGIFAEVLKDSILPTPENCLAPPMPGRPQVFSPREQLYFPQVVMLTQEVLLLALHTGQLARDFRVEARQMEMNATAGIHSDPTAILSRRSRIQQLHRQMNESRNMWRSRFPAYTTWLSGPEPLPPRVFDLVMHSYLLFRACKIYAHTSMYAGQLNDPSPDSEPELRLYCREILQAAQMIISQEHFELRFIVFPLFLAGFASRDMSEKELALNLIRTVERHSYGASTESIRKLLETIHARQRDTIFQTGSANEVDWVEEMELTGQQLIIYGL